MDFATGLAGAGAAAILTGALIRLLWPVLQRYAMARPTARGLHKAATPQGAGLAIMGAVCLVGLALATRLAPEETHRLLIVLAAAGALAATGWADDVYQLSPALRLALQLGASAAVVFSLPDAWRLLPSILPVTLERALLAVAGAWFVNLVNFMDGMDWMTVAEIVPVTGAAALFWAAGLLPDDAGLLALALFGGMIGFAPFNKPVARLFLGDVGSLSIGLITGYCLLTLALAGQVSAALLLPLYYLVDSGVTLLRRAAAGKRVWEAHREHYYQQAVLGGMSPLSVAAHVLALNIALAGLAAASAAMGAAGAALCLAAGLALVILTLRRFAR